MEGDTENADQLQNLRFFIVIKTLFMLDTRFFFYINNSIFEYSLSLHFVRFGP